MIIFLDTLLGGGGGEVTSNFPSNIINFREKYTFLEFPSKGDRGEVMKKIGF